MRVLAACSLGGASHLQTLLSLLDAARERGDDTLVIAPAGLAEMVGRSGHPFQAGGEPPESVVAAIREQLPILPAEEASVLGNRELFGRLATDAMMPAMEQTFTEWRPQFVLRDPCEYASAVVALRNGVPFTTVAIGLADVEWGAIDVATPELENREPGIVDALRRAPYVSRFPPSLDDSAFPDTRRFHMALPAPASPIPDWWNGTDAPLIYASLGTVFGHMTRAPATYRMLMRALTPVNARIILTVGQALDPAELDPVPNHIHVERWVDQGDVFDDADLVVCHGGSGTAFGALAAGVPLIVVPMFADQSVNGRRIEKFGAGMMVESARAADDNRLLTPHDALRITQSIAAVLAAPFYQRRARALADEMVAAPSAAAMLDDLTR